MKISKLFACIASDADEKLLTAIAGEFAYQIELLEGAVLFDVSGLQRLIGSPQEIAKSIETKLKERGLAGNVAISRNADSALLLARNARRTVDVSSSILKKLPVASLPVEEDTLGVFHALGIESIEELKLLPKEDLISRYGKNFQEILDLAEDRGKRLLSPNLKETSAVWNYEIDFPTSDFERLIFILGHGLTKVFDETNQYGFSVEHIDLAFALENKSAKTYEIKVSFPTLEKNFWLKLINLRIAIDPPEAAIISLRVTAHFAHPRTAQRGLFSATTPEPESLLLTVNKIKKLVGEENVGVPVLLNRHVERAFTLAHETLPVGREIPAPEIPNPIIAFNYFYPPLAAEIFTQNKRLIFLRTKIFKGRVKEYGGVWKESSEWWTHESWFSEMWDVELENKGVYRLMRKSESWFVIGEYD